jgi:hypothetical protein
MDVVHTSSRYNPALNGRVGALLYRAAGRCLRIPMFNGSILDVAIGLVEAQ